MIHTIDSNFPAFFLKSTDTFPPNFQGKVVSSLTKKFDSAAIVKLAKIVASLAMIVFSVVAIAVGIQWLFSRRNTEVNTSQPTPLPVRLAPKIIHPTQGLDDIETEVNTLPVRLAPKIIHPTQGLDDIETEVNTLPVRLAPKIIHPTQGLDDIETEVNTLPVRLAPKIIHPTQGLDDIEAELLHSPITKQKNLSDGVSLFKAQTHFNIPAIKLTDFPRDALQVVNVLNLLSNTEKAHLQKNLVELYQVIPQIATQMKDHYTSPKGTPNQGILDKINQLGPFQQEAQNYGNLVIELEEYLKPYHDFYILSVFSTLKPLRTHVIHLLFAAYRKNADSILAALAEKSFNEANFDECFKYAKEMFEDDLKKSIIFALANHHCAQHSEEKALKVLKELSYSKKAEKFILDIAQTYFINNDLQEALKIAKGLTYSKEQEEFILNIAKTYFNQNDLQEALKIAKGLTYSKKQEEFILNIAKTYFNQNDLQEALKIAKGLTYSKEQEEFILNIAKTYFNQNDLQEALKIAKGLTYSKEQEEFIQQIK